VTYASIVEPCAFSETDTVRLTSPLIVSALAVTPAPACWVPLSLSSNAAEPASIRMVTALPTYTR
jgi:hypothetical protein